MRKIILKGAAALLAASLPLAGAAAATVADAAGDFLDTYTGPENGDLDILSASAYFDGASFRLGATVNGAVGTTSNTLHVFGVNRGAGTALFAGMSPSTGAGILFDAVVVLFPDSVVRVVNFQAMGPPVITQLNNASKVNGNSLELLAPLSLLGSRGFAAEDYQFSMWTRRRINIAVDSGNFEIGDFAPNASTFTASVPEPATWAMLILGFGLIGTSIRRRRRAPPAEFEPAPIYRRA